MRSNWRCVVLLLSLATSITASAGVSPGTESNLAVNAGFEEKGDGPDGIAEGWRGYATEGRLPTLDTKLCRSGRRSVRIQAQGKSDGYVCLYQQIPVNGGSTYEFEAWIRNNASDPIATPAQGSLGIEWYDSGEEEISRTSSEKWDETLSSLQWSRKTIRATAPEGVDHARFVLFLSDGASGSGSCNADDIVIREKK